MQYFSKVVDFVNANILWVLIAFCAAWFVETLVFVIRKFKRHRSFETDRYYVAIASNVFAIVGVYILACLGVGLVNCIKDQDWHFWQHYLEFLQAPVYLVIAPIVCVIILIVMFFVYRAKFDGGFIGPLLLAALTAVAGVVVLTIVGFLLYVIVAFLIILFKVLWFVISGFFVSMWEFIKTYWYWVLGILLIPGIIYGAIKAFINYLNSFKEKLFN